jgi:hypothetical protein
MRRGAVLRVTGDWLCEASLYTVLSLALTKMKRMGYSESVCGSPRTNAWAPTRPGDEVVALLGSGDYESLEGWGDCHPGSVVILVEHPDLSTGVADIVIPTPRRTITESLAAPFVKALRHAWTENVGNVVEEGLRRCAMGIDLPPGYFGSGPLPSPFVPARSPSDQPTEWATVEGVWLARHVLRILSSS